MKQEMPSRVIQYPKSIDEPKGYVHWDNPNTLPSSLLWGDAAPSRVKVYMNLRLMCLSVLDAKSGKLYCHAHNVRITDAEFRVQQAGRKRVLREGRKNVHAYIVGRWVDIDMKTIPPLTEDGWESTYYDPYVTSYFTSATGKPVKKAKEVCVYDKTAMGYIPYGNIFYKK